MHTKYMNVAVFGKFLLTNAAGENVRQGSSNFVFDLPLPIMPNFDIAAGMPVYDFLLMFSINVHACLLETHTPSSTQSKKPRSVIDEAELTNVTLFNI